MCEFSYKISANRGISAKFMLELYDSRNVHQVRTVGRFANAGTHIW